MMFCLHAFEKKPQNLKFFGRINEHVHKRINKIANLRTCVEISMLKVFSVATDAEPYSLRNVIHNSFAKEKPFKILKKLVMDFWESLERFCPLLISGIQMKKR